MQRTFYLLILFASALGLHAQNASPVQVFSPNAAELGKYGQVPVDYFNGLPQINIPLTTFKAKGYDLPISLSYYAGGNKPDAHPGWVGQGWSLHAGGMINRIVNGWKDERTQDEQFYSEGFNYDHENSYLYQAKALQDYAEWNSEGFLNCLTTKLLLDADPDEFQVNVDDIQASFFIVGDNEIKIKSKTDVNFKAEIKLGTKKYDLPLYEFGAPCNDSFRFRLFTYIKEIIITKDNGVKYWFGGDDSAIEFSVVQNAHYDHEINTYEWNALGIANSWMLRRIQLPNGENVWFDYKKEGVPIVMTDSHYGFTYCIGTNGSSMNGCSSIDSKASVRSLNVSFTFILPSYLTSIKSSVSGNEMYFDTSHSKELRYPIVQSVFEQRVSRLGCNIGDSARYNSAFRYAMKQDYYLQLDGIRYKGGRIRFNYTDDVATRLKLLSLSFHEARNMDFPETYYVKGYKFQYNARPLPAYCSKETDNWGYYNHKYYGNTGPSHLAAFRTADKEYLVAEMLQKIFYPTGGSSTFEYEPHDYSRVAGHYPFALRNEQGVAGGLRIKKITDSNNRNTIIRTFRYQDEQGVSSGISSGIPVYYAEGWQHVKGESSGGGLFHWHIKVDYTTEYNIYQEDNLTSLSTTNGNHVTYSRVIESLSDGSETIYYYSNHDEYMDNDEPTYTTINNNYLRNAFTSKELERGLLERVEYVNNAGAILKTEQYRYNSSPSRYDDFVKSIYLVVFMDAKCIRATPHRIYTFYPYLESKTVTVTEPGMPPVTTTTDYEYNADKQLTKSTTRNSKNEEEISTTLYSGDLSDGVYTQMKEANMTTFPVEETKSRNGKVIEAKLSTYKRNNFDYVIDKVYSLSTKVSTGYFNSFNGVSPNSYYGSPDIEYPKYDDYGDPLKCLSKEKGERWYAWGYSYMYPIAIFERISGISSNSPDYVEVFYESFEDAKRYAYGPKGFHSERGFSGVYMIEAPLDPKKEYIADYHVYRDGKWQSKRVLLLNGNQMIDEGGATIDEVRVYATGIQATSFTYAPFIGLLSKTDEKGTTESYEYDAFGRLILVNDDDDNPVKQFEYNYYDQFSANNNQ
ncbi:MAG: RHS repeat protein [Mediterranea sp.]|jgi:YD repeat-containing protein|nr:RHS repeat protein [Mediterranea sp.]